jgi:RecA-family ATPase
MKVVQAAHAPMFPPISFLGVLDPATIRPVQFLYGFFYARGYTSLTIAPPKVGKSLLAIAEAVDMASGGAVFGRKFEPMRVLYYNGEDGLEEIKARVAAVCINSALDPKELAGTLSIESGADWPDFFLMGPGENGAMVYEAALKHLEGRLDAMGVDVAIFDPLQDLSRADESNETFRLLGQRLRLTAQQLRVAIGLETFCALCEGSCGRIVSHVDLPLWAAILEIGGTVESHP